MSSGVFRTTRSNNSSKELERNREDRHKVKHVDHHKSIDSGHRCICGYARCVEVRDGFLNTGHIFDRAPIRFKVPAAGDKKWEEFFDSLMRNLHVQEDVEKHIRSQPQEYRFCVCVHHFTEEAVQEYWANTKIRKRWAIRLDRTDARMILHLPLDERDTDDNGKFWINANNPMMDAAALMLSLHSDRGERVSARSSDVSDLVSSSQASSGLDEKEQQVETLQNRVKELKKLVENLREQHKSMKKTSKRRKDKVNALSKDNRKLRVEREESYSLQDVTDMLVRFGGLNRINLFNKEFHAKYPGAAKCLWGANTYEELLALVECAFPDVDIGNVPIISPPSKRRKTSSAPDANYFTTPLERCLVCRLFFRRELSEEFLSLIFGKHRTTIGNILKEWAPRWGKFGEQISILDVTKDYLDKEQPDRSSIVGVEHTVNVDGTDTKVEKSRKDPTAAALSYGSKNSEFGARALNWCTATCLAVEHSPLFLARASEKSINELWGSQGKAKAPLKEWKGIAGTIETTAQAKILTLETAMDNVFDYHDMEKEIDLIQLEMDKRLEDGAVDDGVLLTATLAEVDEMPGIKLPESRLPPTLTDKPHETMEDIDQWCIEREATMETEKQSEKVAPLIQLDQLKELNRRALTGGVNSSGIEKLCQLEVHERLHRAYQEKKMTKTILSYYLLETEVYRHTVLKWLGSDLAPDNIPMPSEDELPDIWLRLAKIPEEYDVLGDKGFWKTERYYPNFSTPWKLSDKKVQKYRRSDGMIVSDRETSDTRVVVEDDYERYRNEDILKGSVPFWQLAMLPYAHEWGHAMMNLGEPMRRPGEDSCIANIDDYWDKHCPR